MLTTARALRFIVGATYFFLGLCCIFVAVFAYANVYFALGLGAVGLFSTYNGIAVASR